MDPFTLFTTADYTFLELAQVAGGNKVVAETNTDGVIKYRDGLATAFATGETYQSASTLHMRPDEPFIAALGGHLKLVGHGIRAGGDDYRIEAVRVGTDFETGQTMFYHCTLKKESLWASALPLT